MERLMNNITGRMVGVGITMVVRGDYAEIARVIPGGPADTAGVRVGDIIIAVNGESVVGWTMDEIAFQIRDINRTNAILVVQRGDMFFSFDIEKEEIRHPSVVVESLDALSEAEGFGDLSHFRYMEISTVNTETANEVRSAIRHMRGDGVEGLILDLRGNTGGDLGATVDIANQLVPRGIIFTTIDNTGRTRVYSSTLRASPFSQIVVLVDRNTASAAEIIASALQDSEAAIVIGENTFGKGVVQRIYALRTGGALMLTTDEYFRRDGGVINEVGVIPDIVLEARLGPEGEDLALLRALEILTGR
jgi:carboxyl-terminal processing protease